MVTPTRTTRRASRRCGRDARRTLRRWATDPRWDLARGALLLALAASGAIAVLLTWLVLLALGALRLAGWAGGL